jgi:predicted dehydrogenase
MKAGEKVWLIGAGPMALEYAKILKALNKEFIIIARSKKRAIELKKIIDCEIVDGGIESFIKSAKTIPLNAINAVGIDKLSEVTHSLLNYGVKNILLEKPGISYASEIKPLAELAKEKKANVLLAYNRRFYQSVIQAKKIIQEDGGVTSFNFEFTEWSHTISTLIPTKTQAELQNWFLGNSTHVIDLAFFLGGKPKEMSSYYSGKNNLDWHTASSNYSGSGISENGALFSYCANWKAPGRFSVEILTDKHRLIFRPLEKLQIQNIGSVAINQSEGIDYTLDETYKPGVFLQTKAFLENNYNAFPDIFSQQYNIENFYLKMSGY